MGMNLWTFPLVRFWCDDEYRPSVRLEMNLNPGMNLAAKERKEHKNRNLDAMKSVLKLHLQGDLKKRHHRKFL